MQKFSGVWSEELIKELIISHQGRSHRECAIHMSNKHGVEFTRDSVKNKFVSLGGKVTAEQIEPLKNRDYFDKIVSDEGKNSKRTYFVTSAIAGFGINQKFLKSIKTFCSARKAKLIILPMRGVASKLEEFSKDTLKTIEDHIYTEYTFNSNLECFDIGLNPTAINPLTGLNRLAQKKASLLIASPKQNLESIPTSNSKTPHLLQSTGTISEPSYSNNRIGILAKEDHIVGGIVVEVENDEIFHIRQVQAAKDGSFYDLDKKYKVNGFEKAEAAAMVWGDLHAGSENEEAVESWAEVMSLMKPKHVFLHDIFSSSSVNHHESHNLTAQANRKFPYTSLKEELDYLISFMIDWTKMFPKVNYVAVASNHDEHVSRYLNEGRYIYDPKNLRTSLELGMYLCDGKNPIEAYIENKRKEQGFKLNLKWLKRDEDFKVEGVQCAAHGDLGANGTKGTLLSTEKSYFNSVTGHLHSPRIYRQAYQVGTSTELRLNYTKGPSSWLNTSCLIYPGGFKTLITSIGGKWKN